MLYSHSTEYFDNRPRAIYDTCVDLLFVLFVCIFDTGRVESYSCYNTPFVLYSCKQLFMCIFDTGSTETCSY